MNILHVYRCGIDVAVSENWIYLGPWASPGQQEMESPETRGKKAGSKVGMCWLMDVDRNMFS